MTDTKLTVNTGELPSLTFYSQNSAEILRLDEEGMVFMGERIKDAGEAYAAWMKAMAIVQGRTAP